MMNIARIHRSSPRKRGPRDVSERPLGSRLRGNERLDYLLGTSPWFMLVLTPLGMVAGILNVIRAATSMEAKRHLEQTRGEGLPQVKDDDD
jgi:hypothetical protein